LPIEYLVCLKINHFFDGPCQKRKSDGFSHCFALATRHSFLLQQAKPALGCSLPASLGGLIHAQTAVSGAQSWLPSYATYPYGIAADGSGNIFVAVNNSGTISEVIRSGGAYTQARVSANSTEIELRKGITPMRAGPRCVSAPNQVKVGLRVTITATVTDASILSIVPEGGGVTLTDVLQGKAVALNGGAPVPLSDGKAVLSVIPSVAGKHTITAHYTGLTRALRVAPPKRPGVSPLVQAERHTTAIKLQTIPPT